MKTVVTLPRIAKDGFAAKDLDDLQRLFGSEAVKALMESVVSASKLSPCAEVIGGDDFSEDALADRFVDRNIDLFRVAEGRGWMFNTGDVWAHDSGKKRYSAARELCRKESERAPHPNIAKSIKSLKTRNAVVQMAECDPRLFVSVDEWDVDPMALNTPAGIVDLASGKMRKRKPEDYVTQVTTVSPDSSMLTPVFDRFMDEIFQGDQEMVGFIQRVLGYSATASRKEQVVIFCHGSGSNGKNTLLDLFMDILGTYALKLGADVLIKKRNTGHPTELAQLHGKRFAFSNETERNDYWNESRLKELTGDSHLSARYMRQDFFTFRQTQKHIICGNFRPRMIGGDGGMNRRMVLVPFNAKFSKEKKDRDMPAKLIKEAPGILNWIIQGAVKWHQEGLRIPEKVKLASREYCEEMDEFQEWIEDCCEIGGDKSEAISLLYDAWSNWKTQRGEKPGSMKGFVGELKRRLNITQWEGRRKCRGYNGIGLTPEEHRAANIRVNL